MNSFSSRFCLLLCLALVSVAAHADGRSPASEAASAASSNTTAVSGSESAAESAGTAADLPDLSEMHSPVVALKLSMPATPAPARSSRISFTAQQSRGVSPLASMPLAGAARRLGAERFNTDDGDMLADFAICYRLTGWSSIEVIPGDPAPVKLPVVTMANNTGVTVGMVYRLNR